MGDRLGLPKALCSFIFFFFRLSFLFVFIFIPSSAVLFVSKPRHYLKKLYVTDPLILERFVKRIAFQLNVIILCTLWALVEPSS